MASQEFFIILATHTIQESSGNGDFKVINTLENQTFINSHKGLHVFISSVVKYLQRHPLRPGGQRLPEDINVHNGSLSSSR